MDRSTVCRLSHSATVTLGARGTSRTCLSSFSDWRLDRNGLPGELVEEEGVEPSFAGCRPAVLPLNDSPEKRVFRLFSGNSESERGQAEAPESLLIA